jgi:hypothetical protein
MRRHKNIHISSQKFTYTNIFKFILYKNISGLLAVIEWLLKRLKLLLCPLSTFFLSSDDFVETVGRNPSIFMNNHPLLQHKSQKGNRMIIGWAVCTKFIYIFLSGTESSKTIFAHFFITTVHLAFFQM